MLGGFFNRLKEEFAASHQEFLQEKDLYCNGEPPELVAGDKDKDKGKSDGRSKAPPPVDKAKKDDPPLAKKSGAAAMPISQVDEVEQDDGNEWGGSSWGWDSKTTKKSQQQQQQQQQQKKKPKAKSHWGADDDDWDHGADWDTPEVAPPVSTSKTSPSNVQAGKASRAKDFKTTKSAVSAGGGGGASTNKKPDGWSKADDWDSTDQWDEIPVEPVSSKKTPPKQAKPAIAGSSSPQTKSPPEPSSKPASISAPPTKVASLGTSKKASLKPHTVDKKHDHKKPEKKKTLGAVKKEVTKPVVSADSVDPSLEDELAKELEAALSMEGEDNEPGLGSGTHKRSSHNKDAGKMTVEVVDADPIGDVDDNVGMDDDLDETDMEDWQKELEAELGD